MKVDKDVYVQMRDGVSLAVDLYQPDELSAHAAIVLITPYEKDAEFRAPLGADGRPVPMIIPVPAGVHPLMLEVAPLAEAGFVVAVADARGTGYSEGVYDYYNLEDGKYDGYDLVEWVAAQSWCTGEVGIMGRSAAAIYCYLTALSAPPHLKAMAPNMHVGDFYFDQWRIGGVFRFENRVSWAMGMHAHIALIDPGEPSSPSYERKRAVYEDRFRRLGERITAGKNPVSLDWAPELHAHDRYDETWKNWSVIRRASEITIPTLHGGVWFDHFIRGTLTTHAVVDVPKRLFVAPGSLMTRTDLGDGGFGKLQADWFDHFLRKADNGVLDGPAARLYLMGLEDYVDVPSWPIDARLTELYLRRGTVNSSASLNDGGLSETVPDAGETAEVIEHDPGSPHRSPSSIFDQRDFEAGCLTFTSDPLREDLDVVGTPRLVLYATTSATDLDWCVRLCDVDEEGRSKLLNTGALKGSHHHSHETPSALVPGQLYRFEIEIWPIANRFLSGHRIRVDVSNSDFPFFAANSEPSVNQIFHDADHPSSLSLPVVATL